MPRVDPPAAVTFLVDGAAFDPAAHLLRRPRDWEDVPRMGIFAQRAGRRPNAPGVTAVAIERVEGCSVPARGLDAINLTPMPDIKPQVRAFDSPPGPSAPEWVARLVEGDLSARHARGAVGLAGAAGGGWRDPGVPGPTPRVSPTEQGRHPR